MSVRGFGTGPIFQDGESALDPKKSIPQKPIPQKPIPKEQQKTAELVEGRLEGRLEGKVEGEVEGKVEGKVEETPEGPFAKVPPELTTLIFQAKRFENWYDPDLQAILWVSTQWQALIMHALLESGDKIDLYVSQILRKAHYSLARLDDSVKNIFFGDRCREKVHTLTVPRGVTDDQLLALCTHFPKLKAITFTENFTLTKPGIQKALLICQNLTELRFEALYLTDTFLQEIAPLAPQLECFEIWNHSLNLTVSAIGAFVNQCPQLTHLRLPDSSVVSELPPTLSKHCPRLTHFGVRYSRTTEEGLIAFVTRFPNLIQLDLGSFGAGVTDQLLEVLGTTCKNLTSIDLTDCRRFTTTGIVALLQNCPIERITLSGTEASDEMLQALAQYGKFLRELNLDNCREISDAGLVPVIRECPLTKLSLMNCHKITDDSLEEIAIHRTELEYLCVRVVVETQYGTSRYGVLQVLSCCPKLKWLDIVGKQNNITELFAHNLAKAQQLETLHVLDLTSQKALEVLLPVGSQLKRLEMLPTFAMTDSDRELIAKNCKNLRWLALYSSLGRYHDFTTEGVRSFLQKLPLLEYISCSLSGNIDVGELQAEFPNVDLGISPSS